MNNKKLKSLLLQLPFPFFNHSVCETLSSIPLAAGYLKSMAYKINLFEKFEIEILDLIPNEFYGDAMLIDTIISKRPDVVGLSLYLWNLHRSLYIIKEIKSKLPNSVIIIGGPEVTAERTFIDRFGVDIAIYGEGEFPYVQILKCLSFGEPLLKDIGNICFKDSEQVIMTAPGDIIDDLNEIPSPYLLDFIDPSIYKRLWLETMRWCAYRCKYCAYPKRSIRKNPFYSPERIKEELTLAKRKDIKMIDLHDSAFNLSPKFNEICNVIEEINSDGALKFKVFLRPELITKDTVNRLLKCNIMSAEVGLQSTNPMALKNVGRQNDLKKFIQGVRLLKKAGIDVLIDIMVGLPGDTLETILETIDFLVRNRLDSSSAFSILSAGPSTYLWKEREQLGLKIQTNSPYYVLQTPTLTFRDIKKAIELCKERLHSNLPKHNILYPYNNARFPFLYTYSHGKYPDVRENETAQQKINSFLLNKLPITKIILDINYRAQSIGQIKSIANKLRNRLANTMTIQFRCLDLSKDIKYIKEFLEILSTDNPYTIWNIGLETENYFSLKLIDEVEKSIFYHINHWDYLNVFSNENADIEYKRQATKIMTILPFLKDAGNKNLISNLESRADIFWSILIEKKVNQMALMENLFEKEGTGYLIDFNLDVTTGFILNTLGLIQTKRGRKIIRFKNRLLQIIWDTKYDDSSVCTAGDVDLIFKYGWDLKEEVNYFQKEKIKFDLIEWNLSCGRYK